MICGVYWARGISWIVSGSLIPELWKTSILSYNSKLDIVVGAVFTSLFFGLTRNPLENDRLQDAQSYRLVLIKILGTEKFVRL